jgi:hypothetical protein
MPMVDTLQPALVWKPAESETTKYDLAVCVGIGRLVSPAATVVAFNPGKRVYYREGIEGSSHHVEDPLANNTVYVWSVRTRNGTEVGPWSTYDFHSVASFPLAGTSMEAGNNLWWPFKTPKAMADAGTNWSNPFGPVAPNQSRIVFFREKRFVGSGMEPLIRINGEVVGNSMSGGYFFVDRPPGTYAVACDKRSRGEKNEISVTLNAGETKYIRTSFSDWQVFPAIEDPASAARAIFDCSYIPVIYQ